MKGRCAPVFPSLHTHTHSHAYTTHTHFVLDRLTYFSLESLVLALAGLHNLLHFLPLFSLTPKSETKWRLKEIVLKHWHNLGWNHVDFTQIYLWVSYYFSAACEFQSELARKYYGERTRTVSNKQALWQILLKYTPSHYSRERGRQRLSHCLMHQVSDCVCRNPGLQDVFLEAHLHLLYELLNTSTPKKSNWKLKSSKMWKEFRADTNEIVRLWAFGEGLSCKAKVRRI